MFSQKMMEALEFSSFAHKDQQRKGAQIPYISHPFGVALLLQQAGYGENVIIAGILHDIVEDTEYTSEDIALKFGSEIAILVAGVTEDKTIISPTERHQKYLDTIKNSSAEVNAISAADMLYNRLSTIKDLKNGVNIYEILKTNKEEYLKIGYKRLAIIKEKVNNSLISDLEEVFEEIKSFV